MKSVLSMDRYKALLAAYGARLELWPEAEREAARAFLASSAEARRLAADEAGLDALFTAIETAAPSPRLARRLAELPVSNPQPQRLWPFRRVWLPAIAWAAAAAVGVVIGSLTPEPENGSGAEQAAVGASAGPSAEEAPGAAELGDDEEDEFFEMALGSVAELEELP